MVVLVAIEREVHGVLARQAFDSHRLTESVRYESSV